MCNFGLGNVGPKDLLWQVDRILKQVQNDEIIYITPLGSMFDDNEVPEEVRNEIFKRIAGTGCAIFGTESRPDTISDEKMRAFRASFPPDMKLQIGLGMESANDYVRRNCINKQLSKEDVVSAIETLHKYNIEALVHVLLKPPFLTEAEAIEDAVQSCNFAFAHGANRVVFFMTNLKPYTLTSWLAERGRYRVPYLWSGASALVQMGAGLKRPVTLSGFYSGVEIEELAHNCKECSSGVISALQTFSQTLDRGILNSILEEHCSCRPEWEKALKVDSVPLSIRLGEEYKYIAQSLFGSQWWDENRDWVLAELDPERIS
jgi:radical SAM enzyme (TIGR01210 family)